MVGEFTDEEKQILKPYFTNLEDSVYAFTGRVPEEVVAVLFSKYSRSKLSLRKNFLKLVKDPDSGFRQILDSTGTGDDAGFGAALEKARDFFQRILVGYGDDSVGELGIAHCAVENCSNIATKRLEDARLTSPLEKSTRYVVYDKRMYYKEPTLMKSKFAEDYLKVNELLLDSYDKQIIPAIEHIKKKRPLEQFETFKGKKFKELSDEKEIERARKAYEAAVRAEALDILRYYLPASTLTNVGITANGRAFEYLISKLMSDELEEVRNIGKSMHRELSKVIPSLVKRAKPSSFIMETRKGMFSATEKVFSDTNTEKNSPVTLIDYDKEAETKLVSAALYAFSNAPMEKIKEKVKQMGKENRIKVMDEYIGRRTNRREKPMRAAETVYYTFDILSDYGAYRDLQRHRMLTQLAQPLTVANGYETPPELSELKLEDQFKDCMKKAKSLYNRIREKHPHEAQYVVPFAYKIRYLFVINLRAAFHLIELRSMPQGHPSYRRIAQEIYKSIFKVHPTLAHYMKYVHLSSTDPKNSQTTIEEYKKDVSRDKLDAIGRLKGELRTQEKIAKLDGKEIKI